MHSYVILMHHIIFKPSVSSSLFLLLFSDKFHNIKDNNYKYYPKNHVQPGELLGVIRILLLIPTIVIGIVRRIVNYARLYNESSLLLNAVSLVIFCSNGKLNDAAVVYLRKIKTVATRRKCERADALPFFRRKNAVF